MSDSPPQLAARHAAFLGSRGKSTTRALVEAMSRAAGGPSEAYPVEFSEGALPTGGGVIALLDVGEGAALRARVLDREGRSRLVLDADDPRLRELAGELQGETSWISLDASNPLIREHLSRGGAACVRDGDELRLCAGGSSLVLANLADVPLTLGGAALHQARNALVAAAVGVALGFSVSAVREGLQSIAPDRAHLPGRLSTAALGGARTLLDRVPDEVAARALFDAARRLPAERCFLVLGAGGARDEAELEAIVHAGDGARLAAAWLVDAAGSQAAARELARLGVPCELLEDEERALSLALDALHVGDLLVCARMNEEAEALERLEGLAASGWGPELFDA